MRGIIVSTNETKGNPVEIEANLKADMMDIDEAILHIATCMQALAQSLGKLSNQLKQMKPAVEEVKNDRKPIELIPNDK